MKFSGKLPGSQLPGLFVTEQTYGWSIGIRAITHALLTGVDLASGTVVDLGCGGGALLAELHEPFADRPLIGLDRHPLAVTQAAKMASSQTLQADLAQMPFADDSAALLLALDSFDQAGVEPPTALQESWRVLCDDGLLLIRVSAGSWLYGPHDIAFNTRRRYDRHSIVNIVSGAGFKVLRVTHANLLMEAPVALSRLLQKTGMLPLSNTLYKNSVANRAMAAVLMLESRYLLRHDLPQGLSLYVLARKERK